MKLTENLEANIRIMKVQKSMELNIETTGKNSNTKIMHKKTDTNNTNPLVPVCMLRKITQ